ncbi:Zinc finger protein [Plakobranchus ocellatus]|uniref:Zinc finger protein n=1 Tax=Plakobranchus ocellatus TaxID=259542 RepID=A0AAV4AR40_9GAST|nr:Zinc finger protein [Plakobranchus ocellatus]
MKKLHSNCLFTDNVSGSNSRRPTFRVPAVPVKIFRCPVCGIAIRHKNNIKRHMRRHNDPAAQGNVDVSKTWSQHFVTSNDGSQLHGGRIGRTYNCPICGLVISHRKNVRRHMRKHTGEMFFCDMCDWRGTCRWKMQKHRERKHNSPSILQQDSPSLVQQTSPLIHNSSPSLVQISSPSIVQHSSPGLVQHVPTSLVQPLQHSSSLLPHGSLNTKPDELCT